MSYQTLGEIIASKNFEGRDVSGYTGLDYGDIEKLIYDRTPGYHPESDEHEAAFDANEDLKVIELNTWVCSDTGVGLKLLVLNGEPIAISWQSGRKCDRSFGFVSEEALDLLKTAWERHRPTPKNHDKLLDPATLAMPIAAPGARAYDIADRDATSLQLSHVGVAGWMDDLDKKGNGLEDVDDPVVLHAAISTCEAQVTWTAKLLDQYETSDAADEDDECDLVADVKKELVVIRDRMLPALWARLEVLEPQASPAP